MIEETFTTKSIIKLYESNIDTETKYELISRLLISNIYAFNEGDNRALYGPMMNMDVLLIGDYLKYIALEQSHDSQRILSVYTKEQHILSIYNHFRRNYVMCNIMSNSESLNFTRLYEVSNFDNFTGNNIFAYMNGKMIFDVKKLYEELKN